MNLSFRISLAGFAVSALAFAPAAFAAGPEIGSGERGSFTIDATVSHDAKPDAIHINVTCELTEPLTRSEARRLAVERMQEITEIVGTDGQIRRGGSPYLYPSYVEPGTRAADQKFTGNVGVTVRNVKVDAASRIAEEVENLGCAVNMDIRLINTATYARQHKEELLRQINEKKSFFEELLGKELTNVSSISLYTSTDYGYNGISFDPVTRTVAATTTLNMTYEFGESAGNR
jgi:hypothetical protein